jgi:hypothetical protein
VRAILSKRPTHLGRLLYALGPIVSNGTFTASGVLFIALAAWARLHWLDDPFNFFDEGLLLTDAYVLLQGGVPYRDFYTNYPPGVFLLIAGVWKFTSISGLSVRLLGFVFQLAAALLAGRVAARMRRRRFSWFACGIVYTWTLFLGASLSAWIAALVFLLLFAELLMSALDGSHRIRLMVAGLALGLVGCFRHDLFVYFVLAFGVASLLPSALYRALHLSVTPRRLLAFVVLGASVPLSAVWTSPIIQAGIPRIIDDLFLTQVRYVMPGRVLPLPDLLAMTGTPLRFLPAFVRPFEGAVLLTFLAPFLAGAMVGLPQIRGRVRADLGLIAMAGVTISVVPQMSGRTDLIHAIYSVTPSLIWVVVVTEEIRERLRSPILHFAAALIPVVVFLWVIFVKSPIWPPVRAWPKHTAGGSYTLSDPRPGFREPDAAIARSRQAVFDFTETHTAPREAVYFGTAYHDRVFVNEADLYFLANRRPGTRYVQFDPNVVTRRDVQEEMIASVERHRVRLVVLSDRVTQFETQTSLLPGSTLFDDYLREHFVRMEIHPPYVIYMRRSADREVPRPGL